MVNDRVLGTQIVGLPIIRDHDGLAMSSRNSYLSSKTREQALALYTTLSTVKNAFRMGETNSKILVENGLKTLQRYSQVELDYLEIVCPKTLEPQNQATPHARVLMAAKVGQVRLIDNMGLE